VQALLFNHLEDDMLTRIVQLKMNHKYGSFKNPIATMELSKHLQLDEKTSDWSVVPLETMSKEDWDLIDLKSPFFRSRILIQSYVQDLALNSESLEKVKSRGLCLQIWFDEPLETELSEMHKGLVKEDFVEWVYCPKRLFHPSRMKIESLKVPLDKLVIHARPKSHEFDGWLNIVEFWHTKLWTESQWQIPEVDIQIFKENYTHLSEDERLFFLEPRKINFLRGLKKKNKMEWGLQLVFNEMARRVQLSTMEHIRWPFMKIYWMVSYQYKKRWLKLNV
jgi:hypothetical protein